MGSRDRAWEGCGAVGGALEQGGWTMDRELACIIGRGAPGQCIEAKGGKRGEGRDKKRKGREGGREERGRKGREGGREKRGREGRGGNLREGGSHSV